MLRSLLFIFSLILAVGGGAFSVNAGESQGFASADASPPLGAPRVEHLPPCPQAAPCRVIDPAEANHSEASSTHERNHNGLLPCPMSVPCYVPDGQRVELPRPAPRPPARPLRQLKMKVTGESSLAPAPSSQKIVEQSLPASSHAPAAAPAPVEPAPDAPVAQTAAAVAQTPAPSQASPLEQQAHAAQRATDAKLISVDASAFNLDEAALYDQASEAARQSRSAMARHDFGSALKLSRRASALVDQVIAMQKSNKPAAAPNRAAAD